MTIKIVSAREIELKQEIEKLREQVRAAYLNGFSNGESYARNAVAIVIERLHYSGCDFHTILSAITREDIEQ